MDVCEVDPGLNVNNPVDLVADARDLPSVLYEQYDTVLLSDILEHMLPEDIVKTLKSSKRCLKNGGKIVITWPEDKRRPEDQNVPGDPASLTSEKWYTGTIPGFHDRVYSFRDMKELIHEAGLVIGLCQVIMKSQPH